MAPAFFYLSRSLQTEQRTNEMARPIGYGKRPISIRNYNRILLKHCLDLYLNTLRLFTESQAELAEFGLTKSAYLRLLSAFGQEDEEVGAWLKELSDANALDEFLGPAGVKAWPSSEGPVVYAQLKEPRQRLVEFLNHDDESISKWAEAALQPTESVLKLNQASPKQWGQFTWRIPDDIGFVPYDEEEEDNFPIGWERVDIGTTKFRNLLKVL